MFQLLLINSIPNRLSEVYAARHVSETGAWSEDDCQRVIHKLKQKSEEIGLEDVLDKLRAKVRLGIRTTSGLNECMLIELHSQVADEVFALTSLADLVGLTVIEPERSKRADLELQEPERANATTRPCCRQVSDAA